MEETCISFGEEEKRCTNPPLLESKFCGQHLYSCVPAYLHYKKKEARIKTWPVAPTPKRILSLYNRLKEVYDLRKDFQKKYIHSSAFDKGHETHLERIEQQMNKCVSFLEKELRKEERTEEREDTEEIDELDSSSLSSSSLEKESKKKSYRKNKEMKIITPAEEASAILGVNSDFLLFFMSNLYPLFAYLRFSLFDDAYVKKSPLRKMPIKPFEDFRSSSKDVLDFFASDGKPITSILEYIKEIYQEGKERGYILYRYYRKYEYSYVLTFIRNQSPLLVEITPFPFPLLLPLEYESITGGDESIPMICSYRELFGKVFEIVVNKSEKGIKAFGVYHLFSFDVYNTADYQPWINLNQHFIGGVGFPHGIQRIHHFARIMHSKGYFLLH